MDNYTTLDFFCDASVDFAKRCACGGVIALNRNTGQELFRRAIIQPMGTNNSGEIGAVLLAVDIISQMWLMNKNIITNIYTDSLLCIRTLRDWLPKWIKNADEINLIKLNGEVVSNQAYYKIIYTKILSNRMPITFYHVKGHCLGNHMLTARYFKRMNGIALEDLNLTPAYVSYYNDQVDTWSRNLLRNYISTRIVDNSAVLENLYDWPNEVFPLYKERSKLEDIEIYKSLINNRRGVYTSIPCRSDGIWNNVVKG